MFKKTVLDSGIRVVTESHRHQKSVAVGAFLLTGTRDEEARVKGISHFVEHMVFKGTKKRNASDIARSIEMVGGDLNAYTTREYTCFHATSLKEDLKLDLEVLGDLVSNATFSKKEIEKERNVILQEVAMTEDTPEEYIFDVFFERAYSKNPLGWPILGTERTLQNTDQKSLLEYYQNRYCGSNIIVAAAGALKHDEVVRYVDKYFSVKKRKDKKPSKRSKPQWQTETRVYKKPGEQVHVLVGFDGVSFTDSRRFDAFILNALLGGGMSSKLYQTIREKEALAYSVYSNITTFTDCGALTIYAGTNGESLKKVLSSIKKDLRDTKKTKLSSYNLKLFKQQVRGGIVLGSEDMDSRMSSLGVNEMVFGRYKPVKEVVSDLDKVTAKNVLKLADEILDKKNMSVVVMGDIEKNQTAEIIQKSL